MEAGNWTSAFYVDEGASAQQREAMEQILSGRMGSPAERWLAMTTDFKGISYVPIEFKARARHAASPSPTLSPSTLRG